MQLLLLRHAESEGNATGEYSGDSHDSLSKEGIRQATQLASRLAGLGIDTVISSPLQRALYTIAPYLQNSRIEAEIWPELAEACWQKTRNPSSLSWPSEPAEIPEDIEDYFSFRDGKAVRPSGSETFGQGLYRVNAAVTLTTSAFGKEDATVLAVTHGHAINEFLNFALKTAQPVHFGHDNCGITRLTYEDQRWSVQYINRPASSFAAAAGASTRKKAKKAAKKTTRKRT